jgi:hypothetical protein
MDYYKKYLNLLGGSYEIRTQGFTKNTIIYPNEVSILLEDALAKVVLVQYN